MPLRKSLICGAGMLISLSLILYQISAFTGFSSNRYLIRGLDIRSDKPWEIGDHVGVTALDENWVTLNQMIKYLKYGFGRVSDYVNEDIRNGLLTREEGILLNEKYDGKCSDEHIETFSRYIGITVEQFWKEVDKSVNLKLFSKIGARLYVPKFKVGEGL